MGIRHPWAGPLVGAGWVVLMTPAVVERWRSPTIGFAPGYFFAVWALWWPLRLLGWHVLIVIPILSGWHYLVQPWLARWLMRATRWPAVVVLPVSVGAAEWLRPILGFGAFNMYGTGSFLYVFPRAIQAADVIGALGLSVVWTLPWAVLVDLLRVRLGEAGERGPRIVRAGAIATAAAAVVVLAYGGYRIRDDRSVPGPTVAVVQPDVHHGRERTPEVVAAERDLTEAHVPPGSVDLVAWPENAILARYETAPQYREVVASLSGKVGAPILFGTQDVDPEDGRALNVAFLVDATGSILGRNAKIYLWPFTERRPIRAVEKLVPPLERVLTALTLRAWGDAPDGKPGDAPRAMTLSTPSARYAFWAPLCYETCYADIARRAAAAGAQFFVNITSEGWFGWGFCNNQMAVSALRAVENRVGVVRAGNTGISCFIRPDGRIEAVLRGLEHGGALLEPGVLAARVRVDPRAPTFYSRFGGVVDLAWPVLWTGLVVSGLARRRRSASAR